jgi:serine/threonine protein kinase
MGCGHSSSSSSPDAHTYTASASSIALDVINPQDSSQLLSSDIVIHDFNNYLLCSYISEGAIGQVYAVYDKILEKKYAIKLFGYTEKLINVQEIYREIQIFHDINGIPGVVEFYGIFYDTIDGIAPNKVEKISYPVICMELLEGGDMFDRIQETKTVSEKYIASIFRDVINAINGMHQRGFLHRDLKLENIMLTSNEKAAQAKIIDFGNVVKMNENGLYISDHVNGTIGYVAPESFLRKEYSIKTDIWQAGVVLYSILSGYQPFNPYKIEQCIEAKYMPMVGEGWDTISADAKDLISKILVRSPTERWNVEQILEHRWVSGGAPERQMSDDYYHRIKQLSLRQKMKKFFLDRDIATGNKERKAKLKQILPFVLPNTINVRKAMSGNSLVLKTRPRGFSRSTTSKDVSLEPFSRDTKLHNLKTAFIAAATTAAVVAAASPTKRDNEKSSTDLLDESSIVQPPHFIDPITGEINFQTFVSVLMECGLSELANRHVFNIFGLPTPPPPPPPPPSSSHLLSSLDIGRTGTIDLKEFLATMVAFRDSGEDIIESEEDATIRFYFNMFDINGTGRITLEDLQLVIKSITRIEDLNEGPTSATEIQSLFEEIDTKKTGDIDFDEFKQFYRMVMISTNSHSQDHS